jgi:hypothetical protein
MGEPMQDVFELGRVLMEHPDGLVMLGNIELLLLVAAAFVTLGRRVLLRRLHWRALVDRVNAVAGRA